MRFKHLGQADPPIRTLGHAPETTRDHGGIGGLGNPSYVPPFSEPPKCDASPQALWAQIRERVVGSRGVS
jgi:hypothetical protein